MSVEVWHGDCLELMKTLPEESVDLIITDPPCSIDFLNTSKPIWEQCYRICKQTASLVMHMLHCNVPIAIEHVMQCGWKWWWIAGMRHEVYKCIPGRNLASIWTPVLWFVKNQNKQNKPRTAENLLFDMVMGTKRDKKYNRFGKPVDWFLHWVLSLTDSDSLVVDPFAGGGAVGVACVVSNRKAILMEREVRLYRVCLNRIRDAKGYQKCLDSRSLSNWSPEPTRRKGY